MNSSFIKGLRCFNCSKYYSIEDVHFPEDVFESIRQHNLQQNLFWICDSCKNCSNGSRGDFRRGFAISTKKQPVYREIDVHTPCMSKMFQRGNKVDYSTKYAEDSVKSPSSPNGSVRSRSNSRSRSSSRSPSPPDKERSARKHTQSILDAIKIPQTSKSKNKELITNVINTLLNNMKENEEFKRMVKTLYYTGSAYNDLKITSATEYDINLILKVPKCVTLSPEFFDGNYAFVKLKWESDDDLKDCSMKFLTENSDENYLRPQKVLSWLQRHIDLTLQKDVKWPTDVLNVVNSESGPARTIIISTHSESISVDLVPVFAFDYALLSCVPFFDKVNEIAQDKDGNNFFFAVPKVCTEGRNIFVADSKLCWRVDFPNAEKYILSEKECAKSVIKILKMFRDKNNWKGLASYYLKMVVILEILKDSSKEYWKNANIFQRLLDCLEQLAEYLENRNLPHFLTQQNLIEKLNEVQCNNWSNCLRNIIKMWESNPESMVSFLTKDNTVDSLKSATLKSAKL